MGTLRFSPLPDFLGSTVDFSVGSGWKPPIFSASVFPGPSGKYAGGHPIPIEPDNRVPIPIYDSYFKEYMTHN